MPLNASQQYLLESKLKAQGRSAGVAFGIWLLAGLCGGHRYYLGKTKSAHAMLLLSTLVTVLLLAAIVGVTRTALATTGLNELHGSPLAGLIALFGEIVSGNLALRELVFTPVTLLLLKATGICFGILLLWWIADVFFIPAAVRRYNATLKEKLLQELGGNHTADNSTQTPPAHVKPSA
jgi:hypothetical protein